MTGAAAAEADDPERITIHQAPASRKPVNDRRTILPTTVTESADLRAAPFTTDSRFKQPILGREL
jgi:hypothetical protein